MRESRIFGVTAMIRSSFITLSFLLVATSCGKLTSAEGVSPLKKINGISFTAPPMPSGSKPFQEISENGASWVCLIPFGFCGAKSATVQFDVPQQWWGERKQGVKECVRSSNEVGLDVMIKPQVWLMKGDFTGSMTFENDSLWTKFENGYHNYILTNAVLAEENKVGLFCIGTEFEQFVKTRPQFWQQLIKDVREVYSGKLTYAANWDEYSRFPFWQDLDLIGVDAYFPLSDSLTPKIKDLEQSWQATKLSLKQFSEEQNRPILFTEFGYRSYDFPAKEPWVSYEKRPLNHLAQANCYQALFNQFWKEDWFAGGFLWKWHSDQTGNTSGKDIHFTPQGKPAQEVLKREFGK